MSGSVSARFRRTGRVLCSATNNQPLPGLRSIEQFRRLTPIQSVKIYIYISMWFVDLGRSMFELHCGRNIYDVLICDGSAACLQVQLVLQIRAIDSEWAGAQLHCFSYALVSVLKANKHETFYGGG